MDGEAEFAPSPTLLGPERLPLRLHKWTVPPAPPGQRQVMLWHVRERRLIEENSGHPLLVQMRVAYSGTSAHTR